MRVNEIQNENMVSVLVPARNEPFLNKTIEDLLKKAKGDIEIIAILDGYWPDEPLPEDDRIVVLHNGKSKGLRDSLNFGAAIASGGYLLKTDAHCMFADGYDKVLKADCEDDWVVIPRRYSLDAENWKRKKKRPHDYHYIQCPDENNAGDLGGRDWRDKAKDPKHKKKLIDDLMTFQGSCWFMKKNYYFKIGPLRSDRYGTFRKEPQEISFNCWLSGGRVVRNKKTWYAHLHKGKKYGRGYHLRSADWNKGDEYNKKWLTNSAWEGQTIDFKWLIDKFNPPGWENYDWSNYQGLENKEVNKKKKEKVKKDKLKINGVRLYQNIEIGGKDLGQNPKKKDSNFWNEGKWDNFIAPLLPGNIDGQTFVEIGSSAGLFLKLAEEKGYSQVVGVEKSKKECKYAQAYRDENGLNFKVLNREVGKNFNFDELPVADVLLLSTVHYYFDIQDWLNFLDKLKSKARYCLLVSRPVDKDQHWKAAGDRGTVMYYFKDWRMAGTIADIPTKNDPHPRENLYSILFESDLRRMYVDNIFIKNERHGTWVEDYEKMNEAKIRLAENIAEQGEVEMEKTDYYKRWVERKGGSWSKDKIKRFVKDKIDLMYDVKNNGLKDPIVVKPHGQICDGGHRLAVLRALGHESVIVRTV